jgi:hypothetical protein
MNMTPKIIPGDLIKVNTRVRLWDNARLDYSLPSVTLKRNELCLVCARKYSDGEWWIFLINSDGKFGWSNHAYFEFVP